MIYQLPDGSVVTLSIEEYLSMDDEYFSSSIVSGGTGNRIRNEYNGSYTDNRDIAEDGPVQESVELLSFDDTEITVEKDIRQIIDEMPDEQID